MAQTVGTLRTAQTTMLDMAYLESGPAEGPPVVLLHGFPYDVHAYDEVAPRLAAEGCRVIVPYLRGYGPTRFRDAATLRSGEQAALGKDLLDLIDVLGLKAPIVGGYDWGGRAACIAAALRPDSIRGLVTGGGYNMMADYDPAVLLPPFMEHAMWYQYYLHRPDAHERFATQRNDICRYIWKIWSPDWRFDDATFAQSAESFANPDFVAVAVHSYRHRWSLADGDPALLDLARQTATQPSISVPTVVLFGESGLLAAARAKDRSRFTGPYHLESLPGIGHNVPQEAPAAMASAVLRLLN